MHDSDYAGSDERLCASLEGRSLLRTDDLSPRELDELLALALRLKAEEDRPSWEGRRSVAILFQKPSLRTRVTFDLGVRQLGGHPVVLGPAEVGLGTREAARDVAGNLNRFVDAIVARVFAHATLEELRDNCRIPVLNALSDREHPCQALADLLTLRERSGALDGLRLAWLGDGNNVLHSLMLAGAMAGMSVAAACPEGYWPAPEIVETARGLAGDPARIVLTADPAVALAAADAVYTDTWVSMGQEEERAARLRVFAPYQVNAAAMAQAKPDALFMHCMPAHRGEEVTDEVMDGGSSVVFDQAENRLHAQKAVMLALIGY
ncbi:MAG: ornithine carbamoyltransferase [Chthonomonadales bacterium]|nr:ornithine carbamoyltransferase [Chthonomonadales bacterium]